MADALRCAWVRLRVVLPERRVVLVERLDVERLEVERLEVERRLVAELPLRLAALRELLVRRLRV